MRPKQVYGKRSKMMAASYSKYLSPDKDDVMQGTNDAKIGAKKQKEALDVTNIERQLEALDLGDVAEKEMDTLGIENLNMNAKQIKDELKSKSTRRKATAVVIERRSRSPSHLEGFILFDNEDLTKVGKSRKVLQGTSANAEIKKERRDTAVGDCTAKTKEVKPKRKPEKTNSEHVRTKASGEEQAAKRSTNDHATFASLPSLSIKSKPDNDQSRPTSSMISTGDEYTSYVSALLALSSQHRVVPFDEWGLQLDTCVDIEKIAEASFSEVYRLTIRNAKLGCANESVLKIVALRTPPHAPLPSEHMDNERPQRRGVLKRQLAKEKAKREEEDQWKSNVEDVHCEVRLLQNLNHIPGFTNFRELTVLQGRPSASFGQAWKDWNKSRPRGKKSEFPDPTKKSSYEDTQLWAVIEMQDAGTDCGKVMELGGISTIWEVWDVFWGVCLSVAKAEEGCRFEHRDLHMDNICIRSSTPTTCLTERIVTHPLKRKLGFTGLDTTVIDYTLSRADIIKPFSRSSSASSCSSLSTETDNSSSELEVAYLDLNKDQNLFEGDADEEYQYEIYRYMRGVVYNNDPVKHEADLPEYTPATPRRSPRKSQAPRVSDDHVWKSFCPKTNLVWAHFILYSLLQNLADKGNVPASQSSLEVMTNIQPNGADASKIHRKAIKMHKILDKIAILLEPEALGPRSRLASTRDLVVLALEAGWLEVEDVAGGAVYR